MRRDDTEFPDPLLLLRQVNFAHPRTVEGVDVGTLDRTSAEDASKGQRAENAKITR